MRRLALASPSAPSSRPSSVARALALALALAPALASCAHAPAASTSPTSPDGAPSSDARATSPDASPRPVATLAAATSGVAAETPAPSPFAPAAASAKPTRAQFVAWLKERIPEGGKIEDAGDAPVRITHTAKKGDTAASIAAAYLDLTQVYFQDDLAKEIQKANAKVPGIRGNVAAGSTVEIPQPITEPFKSPDAERLGLPDDRALKGIYLRDDTHGRIFLAFDKMPPRGMNAVVLDGKDYDGLFTYKTKIPIAHQTGATKHAPIRDLARLVRFAHARGIRMIMRVACFHDPTTQPKAPELSLKGKWGGSYPIGWLDPAGEAAQAYVLEVVKEGLDAGFDEINLDYIRFPVQPHLGNAQLPPAGPARTTIIRDFVRRVHALTKPRGASLSLDVFGVAAFGSHPDIDNLGQDLKLLATECEAIAPMVYPSHYDAGFRGFAVPGDHPEIIGIGTKAATELIAGIKDAAVIRPWLQAFNWKSPAYGPKYVADEVKHAVSAGSVGWLLWNPSQEYATSYTAIPPRAGANANAHASAAPSK